MFIVYCISGIVMANTLYNHGKGHIIKATVTAVECTIYLAQGCTIFII